MNEDLLDLQYKQSGPTPTAFSIRATRVPMKFTTFNTLNDDILLFGVFRYYRLDEENAWNMASPRTLLGIPPGYANGTPSVDVLDHLPPLPLFIDYRDTTTAICRQDESAIHHALLLWDRLRRIDLHFSPSIMHKSLMLMDEPFQMLEHLSLSSTTKEDTSLVLPKTFLAPNLRRLTLHGISLPNRLRLLSSTVSLVTLVLTNIRASGYFLPRPLIAHLWSLHQLEELTIEFSIPIPRPSAERELLGKRLTPVTLPNLKHLRFQGVSVYLECLVAQIRAPLLERLDIMLFNQLAFVLPHLSHFINTTEAFKLPIATVSFGDEVSIITDHDITQQHGAPFALHVMCKELDWQIDCAAQICCALMTPLSGVQELRLDFDGATVPTRWQNGEIDGTTWHELLRSFIGVNMLRICAALSEEVSRALQVNEVGLDPGLLPGLQEIVIETADSLFGSFIHARQVAGRPLAVRSTLSNAMEGSGSNTTEVTEYTARLLSTIEHRGTVVSQRKWRPQNEALNHSPVPLMMPIHFVHNDRVNLGLPIVLVATHRCMTLLDAGNPAPVGDCSTIFIRINWPGYGEWSSQKIMTRDQTPAHNTITVEKFAKHVASAVCRFMDEQLRVYGGEALWRIWPGGITKDHVILIGVVHVSQGSWQPILQLNRHIIPPSLGS
ncbi:hypothetical protein EDB92DRAFT_1967189 [Lactarius akahatsu]|uniref:Uncharacterized protein n=1 Tax=Lactarius akahatsu TaxID=416441 RepID=A0AAD4QFV8_9AGAM|nr:hypothetical protein EDB92DRAFT_1967189 [Lactarius akahatsu]